MSFSVVTNISSLSGQAQLDKTNYGLQQTLAGLTSGLPINTAADDAAGLAVANRFRMDNAGLRSVFAPVMTPSAAFRLKTARQATFRSCWTQRSWKARPNFRLLLWKRQSNC